tara:strand:- start:13288 stop:13557 length:270 start_codon:yes stop_codon:yes gene_type:complete
MEKNRIKFTIYNIIYIDKLKNKLFNNYKFISNITHIIQNDNFIVNVYLDDNINNNIFYMICQDIIKTLIIDKKNDISYFHNNILTYKYE